MIFKVHTSYQQSKTYSTVITAVSSTFEKLKISMYREPQKKGNFTIAGNLFINERFVSGLFTTNQQNVFYGDTTDASYFSEFPKRGRKVYFEVKQGAELISVSPR